MTRKIIAVLKTLFYAAQKIFANFLSCEYVVRFRNKLNDEIANLKTTKGRSQLVEDVKLSIKRIICRIVALWQSGKKGKVACVTCLLCLLWMGSCMFTGTKKVEIELYNSGTKFRQQGDKVASKDDLVSRYDDRYPLHIYALQNMDAPSKGCICKCIQGTFRAVQRVDGYMLVVPSYENQYSLCLALMSTGEIETGGYIPQGYYEFVGLKDFPKENGGVVTFRSFRKLNDFESMRLQRELDMIRSEQEKRQAEEWKKQEEQRKIREKKRYADEQVSCKHYAASNLSKIDFSAISRNIILAKSVANKVSVLFNHAYYEEMAKLQKACDWLGMIKKACATNGKVLIKNCSSGVVGLTDQIGAKGLIATKEWKEASFQDAYPNLEVTQEMVDSIVNEQIEFILKTEDKDISPSVSYIGRSPDGDMTICSLRVVGGRSSFPLLNQKMYIYDLRNQPPYFDTAKYQKRYRDAKNELEVTMKDRTKISERLLILKQEIEHEFIAEYEKNLLSH